MSDAYFFGYGSLVNRSTHDYPDVHAATARGWRRVWRHTTLRPVAYLTVVPDADCEIDGLIASVPSGDWQALDTREHAYDRTPASHQIRHPLPHQPDIALYAIPHGKHGQPTENHPVLLSYLDVVVQGYLREFGESGVARFFATTSGWEAPLLNDRAAPVYPRAQTLSGDETTLVDDALRALGCRVISD